MRKFKFIAAKTLLQMKVRDRDKFTLRTICLELPSSSLLYNKRTQDFIPIV